MFSKVLDAAYLASLLLFFMLSLPIVYIFRMIVILLAKLLRPDLDEIVGGLNAILVCDLLAATPPRINVVVTSVFKNELLCEDVKEKIVERWIEGSENKRIYKKFQQFPVKWLGFGFWKNAFHTFSIDNHVHKLFGKETLVNDEMLNQAIEELLNGRFPVNQSPWGIYVIENYLPPTATRPTSGVKNQSKSVLLFKFHHSLADGFSATKAVTRLFDDQFHSEMVFPKPVLPSEKKSLLHSVMFPINVVIEGSLFLSNYFTSCQWKVPDVKKKWHQMVIRTKPIPLERIKYIKNTFEVSFTGVLLSAISAAIYKTMKCSGGIHKNDQETVGSAKSKQKSVSFLNILPLPVRSQHDALTNEMAATWLSIPATHFVSPLDRLVLVDKMLNRAKNSVFPFMSQIFAKLMGAHVLTVCESVSYNRYIPTGLTNVPGLPLKFELNGNALIDNGMQLGGLHGVTGVAISAISHHENLKIAISVEEGLMSREQAQQFINYITDEIKLLHDIANTAYRE